MSRIKNDILHSCRTKSNEALDHAFEVLDYLAERNDELNPYNVIHCHKCAFSLIYNEAMKQEKCLEYLKSIGHEDSYKVYKHGFLNRKEVGYSDYCDFCPYFNTLYFDDNYELVGIRSNDISKTVKREGQE